MAIRSCSAWDAMTTACGWTTTSRDPGNEWDPDNEFVFRLRKLKNLEVLISFYL